MALKTLLSVLLIAVVSLPTLAQEQKPPTDSPPPTNVNPARGGR